jgi:[protein-PII] uridylyltransferase
MSVTTFKKDLMDARTALFTSDAVRHHSYKPVYSFVKFIDSLIIKVFEQHFASGDINDVCLLSVGGYGRMELCPHSDIDLLILHEGDHTVERIARVVRALWDMGLPLGCVVRSVGECKRILGEDLATDTALLDARYLSGSKELYHKLEKDVIIPYFKKRKVWFVNEMNSAIKEGLFATQAALYKVEPNLKNGICTLRDCQRLVWGSRVLDGKLLFQENASYLPFDSKIRKSFNDTYALLLGIRSALHIITDRRLDILEFSQQDAVAEFLGYGPEGAGKLVEHFFKNVTSVKRILLLHLEKQHNGNRLANKIRVYLSGVEIDKRIKLLDGIIAPVGSVPPSGENPIAWILKIYGYALQYRASISTEFENRIRAIIAESSNRHCVDSIVTLEFKKIFSTKLPIANVLRSMHDTGVLEKIIPEMVPIRCKVEYDSYHEFTVDQHTILALSLIDYLDNAKEPHIKQEYREIKNVFVLRMAVLLHDIGKSIEGKHAQTGAAITLNICDRLGVDELETEAIVFLVQNHLDLSLLAFRREPEQQTILEFAQKMRNLERLRLLYVLTVVDIKSVGNKTWTAWKAMQLETAYQSVYKCLNGDLIPFHTVRNSIDTIETIPVHKELLETLTDVNSLRVSIEPLVGFEQLTICAFDRPHLFADLVACLSSEGYNILSAQITTIECKALDVFNLEPDATIRIPLNQRIQNLYKKWDRIVQGNVSSDKLIEERLKLYPVKAKRVSKEKKTSIIIDNDISSEFTIFELRTQDQQGLLYKVAKCFFDCEVNIVSAKLSTRVSQAIDIFYVTGKNNVKITDTQHQNHIQHRLQSALSE